MMTLAPIPAWLNACEQSGLQLQASHWLREFREQHWLAFAKTGMPTRKHERWKYADLSLLTDKNFNCPEKSDTEALEEVIHQHRLRVGNSILFVFVNGRFVSSLSDITKLPDNVIACGLNEAVVLYPEAVKTCWLSNHIDTEKYPFASINAATCLDGLFFQLPAGVELDAPLHLLSIITSNEEFVAHPLHLFAVGEQSKMTVFEECFSNSSNCYMMNRVSIVNAERGAQFEHIKLQQEGEQAVHIAHMFVRQAQDSTVTLTNFSAGALFSRDDVIVNLQGSGANCIASGFYRLHRDNQYVDHHIDINHWSPNSHSGMLYKGILENKSRAVFNGKVYVEKAAQKILAFQANHNLLLSSDAEVYSKPELEIYADDVKCKHGATIGQMDQEALFYLRSRGVNLDEAISILLQGFSEEVFERVQHPGIKMRVHEGFAL